MYAEIKAALDNVKVISDILRAPKDLRNFNKLASAVSELNAKLLSATTAALAGKEKEAALSERVRLLEEEVIQFKDWEAESQNYTIQEVGMGVFAYVYKPVVQTNQPRHWACTKCFENRQRFTLQHSKGYFYKRVEHTAAQRWAETGHNFGDRSPGSDGPSDGRCVSAAVVGGTAHHSIERGNRVGPASSHQSAAACRALGSHRCYGVLATAEVSCPRYAGAGALEHSYPQTELHVEAFPASASELNPTQQAWNDCKGHAANSLRRDTRASCAGLQANTSRVRRSQAKLRACILASELPSPP